MALALQAGKALGSMLHSKDQKQLLSCWPLQSRQKGVLSGKRPSLLRRQDGYSRSVRLFSLMGATPHELPVAMLWVALPDRPGSQGQSSAEPDFLQKSRDELGADDSDLQRKV